MKNVIIESKPGANEDIPPLPKIILDRRSIIVYDSANSNTMLFHHLTRPVAA